MPKAEIPIIGITERSPAARLVKISHRGNRWTFAQAIYESNRPINICRHSRASCPSSHGLSVMGRHYRPDAVLIRLRPPRNTIRSVFLGSLSRWKKKKLVFISQDEKLHRCRTRIIHRESESERLWSYFSAFLR